MTTLLQTMFYYLTTALLAILLIGFELSGSRRRERFKHSSGASVTIIALAANALLMLGLTLWILFTISR
jgi:hypothetical protein